MTRKDFELIARTLKGRKPTYPLIGEFERWNRDAVTFADALEQHSGNSSFDKARFLKACGVVVQSDA